MRQWGNEGSGNNASVKKERMVEIGWRRWRLDQNSLVAAISNQQRSPFFDLFRPVGFLTPCDFLGINLNSIDKLKWRCESIVSLLFYSSLPRSSGVKAHTRLETPAYQSVSVILRALHSSTTRDYGRQRRARVVSTSVERGGCASCETETGTVTAEPDASDVNCST